MIVFVSALSFSCVILPIRLYHVSPSEFYMIMDGCNDFFTKVNNDGTSINLGESAYATFPRSRLIFRLLFLFRSSSRRCPKGSTNIVNATEA